MAVADQLDPTRPNKATLLGRSLALWRDPDSVWRAFEDRCPHRLAPFTGGACSASLLLTRTASQLLMYLPAKMLLDRALDGISCLLIHVHMAAEGRVEEADGLLSCRLDHCLDMTTLVLRWESMVLTSMMGISV